MENLTQSNQFTDRSNINNTTDTITNSQDILKLQVNECELLTKEINKLNIINEKNILNLQQQQYKDKHLLLLNNEKINPIINILNSLNKEEEIEINNSQTKISYYIKKLITETKDSSDSILFNTNKNALSQCLTNTHHKLIQIIINKFLLFNNYQMNLFTDKIYIEKFLILFLLSKSVLSSYKKINENNNNNDVTKEMTELNLLKRELIKELVSDMLDSKNSFKLSFFTSNIVALFHLFSLISLYTNLAYLYLPGNLDFDSLVIDNKAFKLKKEIECYNNTSKEGNENKCQVVDGICLSCNKISKNAYLENISKLKSTLNRNNKIHDDNSIKNEVSTNTPSIASSSCSEINVCFSDNIDEVFEYYHIKFFKGYYHQSNFIKFIYDFDLSETFFSYSILLFINGMSNGKYNKEELEKIDIYRKYLEERKDRYTFTKETHNTNCDSGNDNNNYLNKINDKESRVSKEPLYPDYNLLVEKITELFDIEFFCDKICFSN